MELLIVIVVIGILSAMMMLSSTEAVSSARANNIINNMRNWKTALLSWYTDNLDRIDPNGNIIKDADGNDLVKDKHLAENVNILEVAKYLNSEFTNAGQKSGFSNYSVKDGSGIQYWLQHFKGGKMWCVGCEFADDHRVEDKLASRANTTGLVYQDKGIYKINSGGSNYQNAHRVWIEVFDFSK